MVCGCAWDFPPLLCVFDLFFKPFIFPLPMPLTHTSTPLHSQPRPARGVDSRHNPRTSSALSHWAFCRRSEEERGEMGEHMRAFLLLFSFCSFCCLFFFSCASSLQPPPPPPQALSSFIPLIHHILSLSFLFLFQFLFSLSSSLFFSLSSLFFSFPVHLTVQ